MITRLREIRRAKRMTLHDVAVRCDPPTTPQTIGRLETGARNLSMAWLNRIAAALGVEPSDLIALPDREDMPVVAILDHGGAHAPGRPEMVVPPKGGPGLLAVAVVSSLGEYRSGDEIWCRRLEPADYGAAVNRDILVPRPAGRFLFGRLIGHEEDRLHLLPLGAGARQMVIADPSWTAVATQLIRKL